MPFGDFTMTALVQREGPRLRYDDPEARGKLVSALEYIGRADYFRTLGVTMLRGREFTAAEEIGIGGTPPVIIDAALAAQLFPNDDPIGQVLQFGAEVDPACRSGRCRSSASRRPCATICSPREAEPHIYLPSGATECHAHVRLRARGRGRRTPTP